jgi:hypothetical protein
MKKVMLLLLLPVFTCSNVENEIEVCYEETIIELERKDIQPIITEQDLVSALILVESRGNDSAIGDRHLVGNEAVGALQIRPIMVREVNRICKRIGSHQRFTLKDRFDRDKSIHMFMIWREFHHKDSSPEKIARNWNGGGRGYLNPRTEKYWNKVEQQLNNQ